MGYKTGIAVHFGKHKHFALCADWEMAIMAEMGPGNDSFREEVRAWLENNCPATMRTPVADEERCWGGRKGEYSDDQKAWLTRMAERGWTAPLLPVAYGGGGLDDVQASILQEEMQRLSCRSPLESQGIWMLAPALLKYGTEAQRREHIPAMVRGEIRWCQGYSEPGAGSDLASVRTSAVDDGESFLVSGQKIWTSHAHNSDWIFCLVRTSTESKHGGITFLLFDLDTPGVTTRPIDLISGASNFCEVFFDGVRVPKANVLGEVNGGWEVAKYVLGHERGSLGRKSDQAGTRTLGEEAGKWLERVGGRIADGALRGELASFDIDAWAYTAAAQRSAEVRRQGVETADASLMKYVGSELNKRRHDLIMACGGTDLQEFESEQSRNGYEARRWLRSKGNSIEGGTSEIQLNIIAKRTLGLPSS